MSFSTWLDNQVELLRSQNVVVSPEVRNLASLPNAEVEEYRGMSAYANHYRIEDPVEGNPYKTYDSGVACIASTLCQFSATDRRPVQANLKYVGVLRKIIRLNYRVLQINVMSCDWIKPNVASNPTMRKDAHGFWLVKRGAYQRANAEPYILPVHASQVISLKLKFCSMFNTIVNILLLDAYMSLNHNTSLRRSHL